MNKQQLTTRLDDLAGQLSALAREVDMIKRDLDGTDATTSPVKHTRVVGEFGARTWTEEDQRLARKYAIDDSMTPEQIGSKLRRTAAAVMNQLRKQLAPDVYHAWMRKSRSKAA